jgi:hypothetical protein
MEKVDGLSYWHPLAQNEYLQGLVACSSGERRVYVVTAKLVGTYALQKARIYYREWVASLARDRVQIQGVRFWLFSWRRLRGRLASSR